MIPHFFFEMLRDPSISNLKQIEQSAIKEKKMYSNVVLLP